MENQQEKQFFIIMARPGGGKGTQAELLKKRLEEKYADVIHVTTGGSFREFMERDSFVSRRTKEVQNSGGLQPEFLAIWNWTNIFINTLNEDTTVILDGAPRKLIELSAIHPLFSFLGYTKPHVIYLDVSRGWAIDRMKYRNESSTEARPDTKSDVEIEKRVDLFDQDILPCIELLKNDPRYHFSRINGEQSIEGVYADILSAVGMD